MENKEQYINLVNKISELYESGKRSAYNAVNTTLLQSYWEIGKYIIEFEQDGKEKAVFGKKIIETLAKDLTSLHGRGFSKSNLLYMRLLYINYPIGETASHQLSWSHYVELLKIDDPLERGFYQQQALIENWSIAELKRQKKSSLFLRLAASKDKDGILNLSRQGQLVKKPEDLGRDPYVLDFLQIPEPYIVSETEIEKRIINNLQYFLLELGKGFAFIGRQYRITLGNRHHWIDLVFYHRILKCFVLIDLKKEEADYSDIGQMNMYLGYVEKELNTEGDNPPIGIVLAKEKDDAVIEYAMHNISSQLFVKKYQLYLPDREALRKIVLENLK